MKMIAAWTITVLAWAATILAWAAFGFMVGAEIASAL